ncbi:MAG: metallophosphoesterase [Acidobacteria bacterium]|nr:metallophosphoesterase [Acidobacteriota bacterium]
MKTVFSKFRALFAAIVFICLFSPSAKAQGATAQDSSDTAPIIFAVIGDTGTADSAQQAVAQQMIKQRLKTPFDFVLMLGDNIYEKGEKEKIGSHFEEPYKELLDAGVKFYATLGNHDIIKGLEFQTNYKNFNMGGRRYYNFTKGDKENQIEFFALDSNLMDETQLSWLEGKLKDSKARWKVAFCHHSIYSSSKMHSEYKGLRAQLEPLYVKYGVNAVFAGHAHSYERVKPQKGVQYFTEGASGEIKKRSLNRQSSLMAAGEDMVNSFLIVQATENEMKVEAIAADGRLIDSYTIKR